MLIGYARSFSAGGDLDQQIDALHTAGVAPQYVYTDISSIERKKGEPGFDACLDALRPGDVLVVWKLDRIGRSLQHFFRLVRDLADRGIGLKVLAPKEFEFEATTSEGKLMLKLFEDLEKIEHEMVRDRIKAGLASARAKGRKGGCKLELTKAQVRFAQESMSSPKTRVAELCKQLGISRSTLYRYIGPDGRLREYGKKVLDA